MNPHYEMIWGKIAEIPKGRVATYGQIAKMIGLPRHARLVGYALRNSPDDIELPWHRVVNARGESAFPPDSDHALRQRTLLEAEGVSFVRGRVPLRAYRWTMSLDEEFWKPV